MFENTIERRAARRSSFEPRVVAASAAVHVLCAVAIAVLPPDASVPVSPDTATFLLLYQPPSTAAPPLLPSRARTSSRVRAFRGAADGAVARSSSQAHGHRQPVEPQFRAFPVVAVPNPGNPPALDLLRLRGVGRAGPVPDSGASHGGDAERLGATVVDAELLPEPPRMVNRQEITAVLGRLYPYRFRVRGTQGEVVMMFIIGTDGRAELESVRVLSATDPGFVEPALKGLARMRFRPAELDGVRVRVRAMLPVTWVLRES
jgi:outer membrane biosynthesis protein TonB